MGVSGGMGGADRDQAPVDPLNELPGIENQCPGRPGGSSQGANILQG